MNEEILVNCEKGHVFALKDFTPPAEAIACISWCPLEVPNEEYGGLILPCGGRVLWLRRPPIDKPKKKLRFRREKQLDLFFDTPLTKITEDVTLASEGQS